MTWLLPQSQPCIPTLKIVWMAERGKYEGAQVATGIVSAIYHTPALTSDTQYTTP